MLTTVNLLCNHSTHAHGSDQLQNGHVTISCHLSEQHPLLGVIEVA